MNSFAEAYTAGLLGNCDPPCLSLYQPTHRNYPDNQQDLVRTWGRAWSRPARLFCAVILCFAVFSFTASAAQQLDGSEGKPVPAKAPDGKPEPPDKVEV
jgi:hypothetical protein